MSVYDNTNGMPMSNGKNLHMNLGHGDVANRVITVGAPSRAEIIASFFDKGTEVKRIASSRGFLTLTGTYQGTPVSVIAIGMGPAMMDFFVRETRAVVSGPMAIIRFGTCGGLVDGTKPGTIGVASQGASAISRNYDAFPIDDSSTEEHYKIYKVIPANAAVTAALLEELRSEIGSDRIVEGVNVTADSFYSSQGRIDAMFADANDNIIARVMEEVPNAITLEMETFNLLHLARCSKEPIAASSATIVVANRPTGAVIDDETYHKMERDAGLAVLKAITKVAL